MSNPFDDPIVRTSAAHREIDKGLRSYMMGIYNYMSAGLALTGVIAYLLSLNPALVQTIFSNPSYTFVKYAILLAPIGIVLAVSARLHQFSLSTLKSLFVTYAVLMGITISTMFLVYTHQSIARTFFVTSAMFLSMSLYGYTTKKDLTSFGSFLIMGVWGLLVASFVNIFLGNGMFSLIISALSVLIFTGLTAYDTQMLKEIYDANDSEEVMARKTIFGALNLYINFIAIFINLLRLFGERR